MLPNKLIQASRLTWRIGVLLIAIAPIAQAATCLRPPAGLANWWSLDGSAKDFLTGNAGAVSGATFTSGKVGQAIQFSSYLDGVNAGSLAIPSDFTIGAWIYPTGSSIGGRHRPRTDGDQCLTLCSIRDRRLRKADRGLARVHIDDDQVRPRRPGSGNLAKKNT